MIKPKYTEMESERKDSREQMPCAACRFLKRKCKGKECILAPCFPSQDPQKFMVVHRVFGASNISRLLSDLEEDKRIDAANSFVYEANMRLKDPVYASAGLVYNLQRCITELQTQIADTKAKIDLLQKISFSQLECLPPVTECVDLENFDWDWEESSLI